MQDGRSRGPGLDTSATEKGLFWTLNVRLIYSSQNQIKFVVGSSSLCRSAVDFSSIKWKNSFNNLRFWLHLVKQTLTMTLPPC